MQLKLANPRGFCAGVDRAIEIVERALTLFGAPIYVRHEVVHNRAVVESLKERGAVFVEELSDVPDGTIVIFSAHGVSKAVKKEADKRDIKVFDATCPLVTKVHLEVSRFSKIGRDCILIGHAGHPEVEGTMGQYEQQYGGHIYLVETPADVEYLQVNNPNELAYVTQTTLSIDDTSDVINALTTKFPNIAGPKKNDICYATQSRQDAVKKLSNTADLVLIVGSPNSSNSNRLREVAQRQGAQAYLIDSANEIKTRWLEDCQQVGVTAGASAPEYLVEEVVSFLKKQGIQAENIELGEKETVVFSLPKELQR
ncbi:MAG: 4-hydroxy-3-methylbut-2-enyl diphosphate reductase [gamma proteobacterium symbiont of Bathyaustriella thionipta]|nr:4-hydroxy-3-methylbut-2-enyl diphosphate reductase [gamma proteobacterium symbiont of Bathyaustriella thionipta]MCU7949585.1 4-hydroxy-3-methylbut-2-enyl diphosphate reductase [gamma proteobacterium symbiont of Bathyaustriella thionipta]MCU7952815.1 4-hydroxy-3-methylbut-2-enyl diphosphate reductase [gamma proteobacterium symbiont of Bathyaustriella thionipta]MCU7956177.1 4-hydroxy-3-methylbut-2-enyl diphosphate reductase [gamma proteobacterium symbiont of Bathyaustriella thionipta]MCU796759